MKQFIVVTADNVGYDILVQGIHNTLADAKDTLKKVYKATLEDCEGRISEKKLLARSFKIVCFGEELYYGCVKEVENDALELSGVVCASDEAVEKPEVKVVSSLEELKAYIEDKDWNVSDCSFGGGDVGWDISQYSPAGEDFSFAIVHNGSFEEAIKAIKHYAYEFDEEEHIETYVKAREAGLEGVPSVRTLVEDAKDIQEMLDDLADGVNWCEQSTIGEIVGGVNCEL